MSEMMLKSKPTCKSRELTSCSPSTRTNTERKRLLRVDMCVCLRERGKSEGGGVYVCSVCKKDEK